MKIDLQELIEYLKSLILWSSNNSLTPNAVQHNNSILEIIENIENKYNKKELDKTV